MEVLDLWLGLLKTVRQEIRKFFKDWTKMRVGNVSGLFTFFFVLFHQPEQEGEAPLQAAATTALWHSYRRTKGEGILSPHHNT